MEEITCKKSKDAVSFKNINDIFKKKSGFENGYTVLDDGSGYVTVNIQFPKSNLEMLDWLFDWVGHEKIGYKI